MNLAPFTFVCPRCRYRNNMEIEWDNAWIQVANWKRDGRCWECAYQFDPLEVIAAFESKHHPGRTNTPDATDSPDSAAAGCVQHVVRRNNVVQLKDGRKYVANKEHELPEGATITAEEAHGDGDFSYLCGSDYCRCCA